MIVAKEKGYAHPGITAGHAVSASREDNWGLRFPQSIRVFSKMAREDAQVKAVIKSVIQPITRTGWRLEANGADPAVVRSIAEDLDLPVKGEELSAPVAQNPRRVSWSRHLKRALRWMLVYGHAYFELVWEDASETEDGLTHLRKIAPRHSDTIQKINVATDGGLKSIEQRPIDGKLRATAIPVEDLLVYCHEDDHDDWVGESMLRAAYKHWRLKDELLRLEQIVLDRNGMGVSSLELNEEADEEDADRAQEIVTGVRSGEDGGVVLKHGEKFGIEGVKGQLVSPRPAIEYHDAMIARTALAHVLNLEGGGSYSLSDVIVDFYFQAENDLAQYMAETANQHLIREMCFKLTGQTSGPYPIITFDRIEAKRSLTPADLALLKNAGLLFAGPVTEAHLRRIYEMPPEEWAEGAVRALKEDAEGRPIEQRKKGEAHGATTHGS